MTKKVKITTLHHTDYDEWLQGFADGLWSIVVDEFMKAINAGIGLTLTPAKEVGLGDLLLYIPEGVPDGDYNEIKIEVNKNTQLYVVIFIDDNIIWFDDGDGLHKDILKSDIPFLFKIDYEES